MIDNIIPIAPKFIAKEPTALVAPKATAAMPTKKSEMPKKVPVR